MPRVEPEWSELWSDRARCRGEGPGRRPGLAATRGGAL